LIIGLGQTGLSCATFLVNHHVDVAVMDTRELPPSLSVLQQDYPEVIVKTGGLDRDWMMRADMIVLSPGVDPRLPEIVAAKAAGVEMVGDIELFARYANAPIVAITGSNGKSTVTTLLAEMAETAGKIIRVGGNLGTPALDLITDDAPDFYIVELSSFQLETVKSLNAFAATILNVSPDHLDRYDSVEDYQQAKARIYHGDGVMVINRDDEIVDQHSQTKRNQIGFSLHASKGVDFGLTEQDGEQWLAEGQQALIAVNDLTIVGKHNVANALAALALGSAMALPMTSMLMALKSYKGLPHRCRLVRERDGVRWFNDSKATNVGATLAAIEGLSEQGKMILIAGGVAKDQDFSPLVKALEKCVRAVVLFGRDAEMIANIIPASVTVISATDMHDVVIKADELAVSGESVLLSPACASFDMFSGYQQRGDVFEAAVMELAE
jgi:UDP-N-acetylmuramoylalanine--D-glutamate ligase